MFAENYTHCPSQEKHVSNRFLKNLRQERTLKTAEGLSSQHIHLPGQICSRLVLGSSPQSGTTLFLTPSHNLQWLWARLAYRLLGAVVNPATFTFKRLCYLLWHWLALMRSLDLHLPDWEGRKEVQIVGGAVGWPDIGIIGGTYWKLLAVLLANQQLCCLWRWVTIDTQGFS